MSIELRETITGNDRKGLSTLKGMQTRDAKAGMLRLTAILEAMSDPTRRYILRRLSEREFCCSSFCDLGPKTRLTYHFARLEQAGLIRREKQGRRAILSLNRSGLELEFPGLIEAMLRAVEQEQRGASLEAETPGDAS